MEIKKYKTIKSIVFPLVLVILFYFSYLSLRWAIADVLSIQVRHQLGVAQTVGRSLDVKKWTLTHSLLEKVLWLRPDYSGSLELAEFFYDIASNQDKKLLTQLNWKDTREKSLGFARQALLLRPTSSFLWIRLASNKLALKQFDNELSDAIERAATLSPWDSGVQYEISLMGLDFWDQLEPKTHRLLLQAADKILLIDIDSGYFAKELMRHANIGKLCETAKTTSGFKPDRLNKFCERLD